MSIINYENKTYKYTNESFSGCDMTATISIKHLDKKSGKEKYFHYTVGELQTISYSINMDKTPVRSIGNVNAKDYVPGQRTIAGSLVFNVFNRHFSKNIMKALNENYDGGTSYLVDEMPPFDITLTAANEYGYRSKLCIFGIRLLNEGQVMSINDVYVENTYQFYATDIDYFDDEMKYSRNKKGLYYLKGNTVEWHDPIDKNVNPNEIKYHNNYVPDNKITLEVGIKQPVENGKSKAGVANFYITPGVKDGNLSIKSVNGDNKNISLKAKVIDSTDKDNKWYKNNVMSYFKTNLRPGNYEAIVTEKDGRKTNTVTFNITKPYEENKLRRYAPIIKNITNTSFVVIPAALDHKHVKVSAGNTLSQSIIYEVKEQVTITDLKEGGTYTIATFDKESGVHSPSKTITLKTDKGSNYKRLKLYIESNSSKLVYTSDIIQYLNILDLCYSNSVKNNTAIHEELMLTKKTYDKKATSSSSEIDKEKYKLLSFMTGELIYFENKFLNNESKVVNKESLTAPIYTLDNAGNNIFHFEDDVDGAEFYKTTGKMNYFTDHVHKTIFKVIDRVKNSFRFIGDSGTNNYVEAIKDDLRSDRVYFYIMSDEEKEEYIAKRSKSSIASEKEINYTKNSIQGDRSIKLTDKEKDIMSAIKIYDNMTSCFLYGSDIAKSDDSVTITTMVKESAYIAVATVQQVLNGEMFMRFPIINFETVIDYSSLDLIKDETYLAWVEDSNFEKISSTFHFDLNAQDQMTEVSEFILDDLLSAIEDNYKLETFRNSELLSSSTIIKDLLLSIKVNLIPNEEAYRIISNIKYYLCLRGDFNSFCSIDVKDNTVCISSSKDGYMYCYGASEDFDLIGLKCGENTIDASAYDLIIVTSKDFIKSDILYRNNKEIEVI